MIAASKHALRAAAYALLAAVLVAVASLSIAGRAYALDVWSAQTQLAPQRASADTTAEVNLVNLRGAANEGVFLTVSDAGEAIARYVPHTIGAGGQDASSGTSSVDVFAMGLKLDGDKLRSGSYGVEVFTSRASRTADYEATLYGVWAMLEGVDEPLLIGTRTVMNGDGAFTAPDSLYYEGTTYDLASSDPQKDGEAYTYLYNKGGGNAGSADGLVRFVDRAGRTVASEKIAGIPVGATKDYAVPAVVAADEMAYRTMSLTDTLTARNPDALTFVVPVAPFSDADSSLQGHYLAKIRLVAGDEEIIIDTVNVTGVCHYTAPSTIYRTIAAEDGSRQVHTYTLKGSSSITLEPTVDNGIVDPETHTRQITFNYEAQPVDALETEVTFNLINGQERAQSGNTRRQLADPKKVVVSADNPTAFPDDQITVDGVLYNLAGDVDDYKYTYDSGNVPVVNAYYVPEGYEAPGPYEVTVSYVDYLTNQVISTETVTSSADSTGDLTIETPESFEKEGVTYRRLPGQEEPISHNYYSNIVAYAVYYHDSKVPLEHDVVESVRVVYETAAVGSGGTTNGAVSSGIAATTAAASTRATGASATTDTRLNQNNNYNVVGNRDQGNRVTTNESGVDSNEERIESDETALSSGLDDVRVVSGGAAAGSEAGPAPWVVPAAAGGVAVIAAGMAYAFLRRRKTDDLLN